MSLFDQVENMGFKITQSKDRIDCESHLGAYLSLFHAAKELKPAMKRANASMINQTLFADGTHFSGGSLEDLGNALSGKIDMTPFLEAKATFAKTDLYKKLKTVMSDVGNRRSRRLSEHDGEWSYDRRWEIQPFQATHRVAAPLKTLDIVAEFSIPGYVDSSEVDRYGAMVWALSQLVEESGVQTRVIYQISLKALDNSQTLKSKTRVILKDQGQYLAPSLLAAAFSCNFKRRLNFAHSTLLAELAGCQVNSGLGTPIYLDEPISFKDGVLSLSLEASTGSYSDEVEREVLKACGLKNSA